MRAIIIAAGLSSRLIELTDDKPKCMLEIGGKTILQRQIDTFRQCGIDDIVVILETFDVQILNKSMCLAFVDN